MSRSTRVAVELSRMFDALRVVGVETIEDREAPRRISMTLQRWFELECGDGNQHGAWAIVRGRKERDADGKTKKFIHDDDGKPYMEHHIYNHGRGPDTVRHSAIPDREKGARKRLAKIMMKYPRLVVYVQTDPRGCALYILRKDDVPAGSDISSLYTRGVAVFR